MKLFNLGINTRKSEEKQRQYRKMLIATLRAHKPRVKSKTEEGISGYLKHPTHSAKLERRKIRYDMRKY